MNIPDPIMFRAVDFSVKKKSSSISLIDEELGCGFATAAMIIDEMEHLGIVGDYRNGRPRRVLMTTKQWHDLMSKK